MVNSNSSKFSPTSQNPRGIEKSALNTKSYNSLMTALMHNDKTVYTNSSGKSSSKTKIRSSVNTPNSMSKGPSSSRNKPSDLEPKNSQRLMKKDLEDYLRHSRNTGSKNYVSGHSKAAKTHASYMHTQKSYR